MVIDKELLDSLTEQAKVNPRLRQAYDLRTQASASGKGLPEDGSQRILNAVEPGTVLPIHRHRGSTETIACLRGKCVQYLYEEVSVPYNPEGADFPQGMDSQHVMTRKELRLADTVYLAPYGEVSPSTSSCFWQAAEPSATGSRTSSGTEGQWIPAMSVEVGQWHRLESLETGTVILECKDGKYEPLAKEDIFEV